MKDSATPEPKGKVTEVSPATDGKHQRGAGVKGEVKLPKLTSDNYWLMPHLLKIHLIAQGLWKVASGAVPIPLNQLLRSPSNIQMSDMLVASNQLAAAFPEYFKLCQILIPMAIRTIGNTGMDTAGGAQRIRRFVQP
ncbi:hypothetical protein MMC22_005044 [Lobaria immixta]|nr:hypothetical protein [Lobaria immixta]